MPWDNIDTSSDPIVLPRIADNCSKDSDASDDAYNAGNRSKADAAAKFVSSHSYLCFLLCNEQNAQTSENEFGFMDEVEELPPPVLVRDFAELVVRKQVCSMDRSVVLTDGNLLLGRPSTRATSKV